MSQEPEPTMDEFLAWSRRFLPEGSRARAGVDMLLRELNIALARCEMVDAQSRRVCEAWHALQLQPDGGSLLRAFIALDAKLCSEGTLDDPSEPADSADRLTRGAAAVADFVAYSGPFDGGSDGDAP